MKRTLLWFPVLVIVFDYLFWNQSPGLNVLVFTVFITALLFYLHPEALERRTCRIFACTALITAIVIAIKGGGWAMFANVLSVLFLSSTVFYPKLRSAVMVFVQTLVSLFMLPVTLFMAVVKARNQSRVARIIFRTGIILGPMCIAAVFYGLYLWGSPHFLQANSGIFRRIDLLFMDISADRMFFFVWAILVGIYFLLRPFTDIGAESDQKEIFREKSATVVSSMMGLKREYLSGLVLLVLLNVLIAIVNFIDVRTLWISFSIPEDFSLKEFVHEGTWVLSFCVILSMTITLWLFRRNQNFYSKNRVMKILAYLWIAQNLIMVYSVFVRNYWYIAWHGLAYGRIFVFFFLFVVAVALILSAIKIHKRHTAGFFIRRNSWIAFACVIAASFVNWDALILRYNFQHRNISQIDYGFYLNVSSDLLHEIDLHKTEIDKQISAHQRNHVRWVYYDAKEYWSLVRHSQCNYVHEAAFMGWQSWTLNNRESLVWLSNVRHDPNE